MEILEDLDTLKFEFGIPEEERFWLYLQNRSRGLMVKGCAHAAFFCKMYCNLRELLLGGPSSRPFQTSLFDVAVDNSRKPNVGIIGCGRLGKQLANVLLKLVPIPAENLRISTRRPEVLAEFQKRGILCFYNNPQLVSWAHVVFLCCLTSQLPNICIEIQTSLEKSCIVYSFVSAIPLPRLKLLLNHSNILRPQYHCVETSTNIWGSQMDITATLHDSAILHATCPYNHTGGVILNIKWLEGMVYAAINVCTAQNKFHSQVLEILNKLFLSVHLESCKEDAASCLKFQLTDFVNRIYVRNLIRRRPFPWFDLTVTQLKETPFSQRLSGSTILQDHLTHLYCHSFGISPTTEEYSEVSISSTAQ